MKGCDDCMHYYGTTFAIDHDEYGEVRETSQCAKHVLAIGRCKDYAPSGKAAPAPKSLAPTETVGNAAAMREALEFAEDELWALGAFDSSKRVAAALSVPARNCDIYDAENGVAECMQEIDAAWHEIDTIRATIGWMLAPAKPETKGEGDESK